MATSFIPFGASHWAALAALAALIPATIAWGRRVHGTPLEKTTGRIVSIFILAIALPFQIYSMLPANWDVGTSLPLHICDLAWMLAAYALWSGSKRGAALLYYWGLTLTPQALITPHLVFDFPHLQYLMFWSGHGIVPLAAVYLTWGLGRRPDWSDYRRALGITLGWGALMLGFNALTGSNYMYLNAKPPTASILDLFGPWPLYLAVESFLIACAWAAMTRPWSRKRTPK